MMLKKKQYNGLNGFHFPSVPRAPRSARGRGVHKRKLEDSQICAIEVLASLAGKLLQESEASSASSNASEAAEPAFNGGVIKRKRGKNKMPKTEFREQGSYGESIFIPDCASQDSDKKCLLKEFPPIESDSVLKHSSMIIKSGNSEKVSNDLKSGICDSIIGSESFPSKVEGGHGDFPDSCDSSGGYVGNEFSARGKASGPEGRVSSIYNSSSSKNPVDLCLKLCGSDNDVKSATQRKPVSMASISKHSNDVKLVVRDDDDKYTRLGNPITKTKAFRPSTRIGDRRIRKLLTSRYWKVAPKLKDCELSKVDGGMKSLYRKRKICCSHERYQHDRLFKRRKFFDRGMVLTSDGGFCGETIHNSPEKGVNIEKRSSAAIFHGENGLSSSVIGHKAAIRSKDSNVRFSIKSFRIPELLIEVPETATVGSLKRTVLKAVTAILGDGLHVGVHLHGKKVGDDNKTLLQTGITSTENLNALGFALEPTPSQALTPVCTAEGSPVPLACDTSQLFNGSPATTVLDSVVSESLPDPPLLTNLAHNIDNNHESVTPPTDVTDKNLLESRALVTVPPPNADTLALVPVKQKPKKSELVQRRTRRPFSVSEVEALVRAVEELGTGRWRDVKLRSFENADHRTYVDLKDKWKTLVHTAKIAPQQRRGEPVPQELLDRVLAAHAYWSQHQVKQHGKNQAAAMKMTTEANADRTGVEDINI